MTHRTVLYLDLDDTILTWAEGKPEPGPGVREFLDWALETFEVRWLTRWAPDGWMSRDLVVDLCKLTGIDATRLRRIKGLNWEGGTKLDGIAWVEHILLERPFIWLEDGDTGASHEDFLQLHGFGNCFHLCNVTRDAEALRRAHAELRGEAPAALSSVDS